MTDIQNTIESLEEAYAEDSALDFMRDAALLLREQAARTGDTAANERGKNEYGLDMSYFHCLVKRELSSLKQFKPDELARVLARASRTADPDVMHEPEFARTGGEVEALREVVSEALAHCPMPVSDDDGDTGTDYMMSKILPFFCHPPQAAKVADGWQLVPIEPTQEMLDAGYYPSSQGRGSKSTWCAMLTAAPQPVGDGELHEWDGTGERCVKCGDKDWFAGPKCDGKAQPPEGER